MTSGIGRFLEQWHEGDPKGFVDALCRPARDAHVLRRPTAALLNDLTVIADELAEWLDVPEPFFDRRDHCYLFAAVADVALECRWGVGRGTTEDMFDFGRGCALVLTGGYARNNDAVEQAQMAILERLTPPDDELPGLKDIEPLLADAHARSPLAEVRRLQNLKARFAEEPTTDQLRRAAASAAIGSESAALTRALTIGPARQLLGSLDAKRCRWMVLADARFEGTRTSVTSLPGRNDESGMVLVSHGLAARIISDHTKPDEAAALAAHFRKATAPLTLGFDHMLNQTLNDWAFNDERRWDSFEGALLEITYAYSGIDAGTLIAAARTSDHAPATPLLEGLVKAIGLRHTLLLSLLNSDCGLDGYVRIPGMEQPTLSGRGAAYAKSLRDRQIEVHGWPFVVKHTEHLLQEMDRQGQDLDEFAGYNPHTLPGLFYVEGFSATAPVAGQVLSMPEPQVTAESDQSLTLF